MKKKNINDSVEVLENKMANDGNFLKWKADWNSISNDLQVLVDKKWIETEFGRAVSSNPYNLFDAARDLEATIYHEEYLPQELDDTYWPFSDPKNWKDVQSIIDRLNHLMLEVSKVKSKVKKMIWPLLAHAWSKRLKLTIKRIKPIGNTKRNSGNLILPRSDKYVPVHPKRFNSKDQKDFWVIGLRYNYAEKKTYVVLKTKDKDNLHHQIPASGLRNTYS